MIKKKIMTIISSRVGIAIQLILMGLWGSQLISSDSYYVNYALLITLTGICSYNNYRKQEFLFDKKNERYYKYIYTILFSCMVSFANYKIWAFTEIPEDFGFRFKVLFNAFMTMVFFAGSFIAFWNVFNAIFSNIKKLSWENDYRAKPKMIFFVSFVSLVLSRSIVLYYCQFPGILTPDSISQMSQLMSGSYQNHHPFYHTMVIKNLSQN